MPTNTQVVNPGAPSNANFGSVIQLIVLRAFAILTAQFPAISLMARGFSDQPVFLGSTIKARVPLLYNTQPFDPAVGLVSQAAAVTEIPVTLDQFNQTGFSINLAQMSSRPNTPQVIEEQAVALAMSVAYDIYKNLLGKITALTVPTEIVIPLASFNRQGVTKTGATLTKQLAPALGRYMVLDPDHKGALENDLSIVANLYNGGTDAIRTGVLSNISGFEISDTQVIPSNDGVLVGIAGTPDGLAFACGAPANPLEVAAQMGLGGGNSDVMNIDTISDPVTGFKMLAVRTINTTTLAISVSLLWIYGTAVGNKACVVRLVSAASGVDGTTVVTPYA